MSDKDKRTSGYPTDMPFSQQACQQKYEDNMKLFENDLHVPDLAESEEQAERARASTMPSNARSTFHNYQELPLNTDSRLQTLIRPYSCELGDFSMTWSDFMGTANTKRMQRWFNPYQGNGRSTVITPMKNEQDMEIEEDSTSQSTSSGTITPLNCSMECNEGSPVTKPIKRELDTKIVQASTTSPAEIAPAIILKENPQRISELLVIRNDIPPIRKRHLDIVDGNSVDGVDTIDSGLPTNKLSDYQNMKDKIRPLAPKCPPKAKKIVQCSCKYSMLLMSMIFIVLTSVFWYECQERKYSSDYASAVVELKKRIYGQDQAIHALGKYLQLNTPYSKIIVLVGGTGVGKSYTVEIIKKNYPREFAIRQYFPPIGGNQFYFPFLHPNLIVLENLRHHDLTDVVNFLKRHQDTYKNRYLTVLCVFNFEQMDDNSLRSMNINESMDAIKHSFTNENINVEIIPYNSLSEDALQKCVMDAMKESKLTLSNGRISTIIRSLLKSNVGCKGAYNKVQLLGRQTIPIYIHDLDDMDDMDLVD